MFRLLDHHIENSIIFKDLSNQGSNISNIARWYFRKMCTKSNWNTFWFAQENNGMLSPLEQSSGERPFRMQITSLKSSASRSDVSPRVLDMGPPETNKSRMCGLLNNQMTKIHPSIGS